MLKDALELLPGLRPLPFFSHVELYTKGYFLPADSPEVIVEWVYQHPFYAPHQAIGLVKALTSRGASGGKLSATFSKMKGGVGASSNPQAKQLLAQVAEASQTHSEPSATMTLEMLVNAR